MPGAEARETRENSNPEMNADDEHLRSGRTAGPATDIGGAEPGRFTLVQRVLREAGIGIALLVMVAVFSAFAPHFTDESNITNILTQVTINLIMATGMTFVILIGGIDLRIVRDAPVKLM